MLRRQARLRREFLYKKSAEVRHKKLQDKKELLENSLQKNTQIHGNLQKQAIQLQDKLKYNVDDPNGVTEANIDDEYRWAGCEDPKIMITTSHSPSARLKMFVKELRLLFPNAQRMNRGNYEVKQLMHACRANEVTDFIIVHEHRGVPDNLVICHLPYGPTAFFNISGVVMRHDLPDVVPMSEQKPHLIFHNFKTKLAERTMNILKHLFPVPKKDSKRVMTFANHDDYICFRHHTYQYVNKELELKEVGPRFQLKLYQIKLGTLDELQAANIEWVSRPYMNTAAKRRFLSDDDGWVQDDDNNV
ncbi:U3 small nucleolar ribonucleoprotein protein IMP4 [Episyrphus balteatus]|uniref:U3 small nucleolar ribonucleoprotein protein IMP4 n=1 Tax=Episyrphus balteatus TaxID=286459 RepID=UPI0024868117|nr:U3 small nucleolar ribonucleoprotein protein IMP4 [Episyrphus balteatus]